MTYEDEGLPRVTFLAPHSSHAGWVSTSWLYSMSVLSHTTPSVRKLTFPGLPYRLQSSLALAATSLLQYNPSRPILVILNQSLSAEVILGKPLVCTHTACAPWHAQAAREFSFAIPWVWLWFPSSLYPVPAAGKLVGVVGSTVLGTSITSSLLSKNYRPRAGELGSAHNTLLFLTCRNDFAMNVKCLSTQAIRYSVQTTVMS